VRLADDVIFRTKLSYLVTRNVAAVHMVEDLRDIAGLFARGLFTAEAGPAAQSP
jgi:hypothetical protein